MMTQKEYREFLIEGILDFDTSGNNTREKLEKKPTRVLERMYDTI